MSAPAQAALPVGETGLFLDGLRCAGCVNQVERALRAAPGVREASINYTTHRALVRFDPDDTSPEALVGCVEALGFEATAYDPAVLERPAAQSARDALVRPLVAAFLAGNVMMIAVALYIGSFEGVDLATRRGLRWLAIALSVPAVSWCALPFWRGAFSGLRRGALTIDVPIVLGIATSFAVSVAGTLAESAELFIDSAAMIVFLILLGRTLERGARARASAAVERLRGLSPPTALRRGPAGLEEVPAEALRRGDRVVVPAAQTVPADGRIAQGSTELDEALLTGESIPVHRREGDPVVGGSLNALCEIEIEVEAPVDSGTLARLASLLERAQAERPRIQLAADRVAAVFAPVVLALASATAIGWAVAGAGAMQIALVASAVLIVACPCALGLATPAAVTAAIGRAAHRGILIKSGEALERCARIDQVVFDKTGTLTEGRFEVEQIALASGTSCDESELLRVAALAEGASTHPVAEALRREAARRGVAPGAAASEVGPGRLTLPGLGSVAGEGEGASRVGARALLEQAGIAIPAELEERAAKQAERGLSQAWVARGRAVLGVVGLADPLRADAAKSVARLRRDGLGCALLSGDHARAAGLAASRCAIQRVEAGISPEQKLAWVSRERGAGSRLAVVGDGINDAAALAAADVGVAMPRGSDVTLQAADVVIRAPRLGGVADLVELSRLTMRRIHQNLAFALLYNAAAVPLAAFGLLHPLYAAIAMSLSSLAVTGNAVRLLRWSPRP